MRYACKNTIPKYPVNFHPARGVSSFFSSNHVFFSFNNGRLHPHGRGLKVFDGLSGCIFVSVSHIFKILRVSNEHLLAHFNRSNKSARFQLIVIQSHLAEIVRRHQRLETLTIKLGQSRRKLCLNNRLENELKFVF